METLRYLRKGFQVAFIMVGENTPRVTVEPMSVVMGLLIKVGIILDHMDINTEGISRKKR